MTIALESEVVASSYDPKTRKCSYTIARSGKRWTVSLSIDDLKTKGNKIQRRNHLATALQNAMNGKPDEPI